MPDSGFERQLAYRDAELLREWHTSESYDVWKRHCDNLLANAVEAVLAGSKETFDHHQGVVEGIKRAMGVVDAALEDARLWRAQP